MDLLIFALQLPLILLAILAILVFVCCIVVGIVVAFEKKPVLSGTITIILAAIMFAVGYNLNQQRLAGRTMEARPAPIELEDEF